jgi:hypothetical protein
LIARSRYLEPPSHGCEHFLDQGPHAETIQSTGQFLSKHFSFSFVEMPHPLLLIVYEAFLISRVRVRTPQPQVFEHCENGVHEPTSDSQQLLGTMMYTNPKAPHRFLNLYSPHGSVFSHI